MEHRLDDGNRRHTRLGFIKSSLCHHRCSGGGVCWCGWREHRQAAEAECQIYLQFTVFGGAVSRWRCPAVHDDKDAIVGGDGVEAIFCGRSFCLTTYLPAFVILYRTILLRLCLFTFINILIKLTSSWPGLEYETGIGLLRCPSPCCTTGIHLTGGRSTTSGENIMEILTGDPPMRRETE